MSYRVENLQDDTYQVLQSTREYSYEDFDVEVVFQGSLTDCDAYIRLHENGYM